MQLVGALLDNTVQTQLSQNDTDKTKTENIMAYECVWMLLGGWFLLDAKRGKKFNFF